MSTSSSSEDEKPVKSSKRTTTKSAVSKKDVKEKKDKLKDDLSRIDQQISNHEDKLEMLKAKRVLTQKKLDKL